jgi:hypothetical protein
MLKVKTKHDWIRQHNNDFDKTTRQTIQECMQLTLERGVLGSSRSCWACRRK